MSQKFTSADTSINKNRLPAVYTKLKSIIPENSIILDYGCGKYTDHIKQYSAKTLCCNWFGYDPYNQSAEKNTPAINIINLCSADFVVCSNVLNVIDDDDTIKNIISFCVQTAKQQAIFTIYEGDKSGTGKATKSDCYQRNERIDTYKKLIESMGHNVTKKHGMLIVTA